MLGTFVGPTDGNSVGSGTQIPHVNGHASKAGIPSSDSFFSQTFFADLDFLLLIHSQSQVLSPFNGYDQSVESAQAELGCALGVELGTDDVEGLCEGKSLGEVDGTILGPIDGSEDGTILGETDGSDVVGLEDGTLLGATEGFEDGGVVLGLDDGTILGLVEGSPVEGLEDGTMLGILEGFEDGAALGLLDGSGGAQSVPPSKLKWAKSKKKHSSSVLRTLIKTSSPSAAPTLWILTLALPEFGNVPRDVHSRGTRSVFRSKLPGVKVFLAISITTLELKATVPPTFH